MTTALAVCIRADRQVVDRIDMRRVYENTVRTVLFAGVPVVTFAPTGRAAPIAVSDALTVADDETPWMALHRWMCGRSFEELCLAGGDLVDDLIPIAHAGNAAGIKTSILLAVTCTIQPLEMMRRATDALCAQYGRQVLRPTLPWTEPFDPSHPFTLREVARRAL